jgi:hypothetical protein
MNLKSEQLETTTLPKLLWIPVRVNQKTKSLFDQRKTQVRLCFIFEIYFKHERVSNDNKYLCMQISDQIQERIKLDYEKKILLETKIAEINHKLTEMDEFLQSSEVKHITNSIEISKGQKLKQKQSYNEVTNKKWMENENKDSRNRNNINFRDKSLYSSYGDEIRNHRGRGGNNRDVGELFEQYTSSHRRESLKKVSNELEGKYYQEDINSDNNINNEEEEDNLITISDQIGSGEELLAALDGKS